MARYHLVMPKYWADMHGLSRDAKLLGAYILTCDHRSTEGLYRLPLGYIVDDLEMPAQVIRRAMRELIDRGFISYDEEARVVFIRKALTYPSQQPRSEKQIQGAVHALAGLPRSGLLDEFRMAAEAHAPRLADALANGSPNGSAIP